MMYLLKKKEHGLLEKRQTAGQSPWEKGKKYSRLQDELT